METTPRRSADGQHFRATTSTSDGESPNSGELPDTKSQEPVPQTLYIYGGSFSSAGRDIHIHTHFHGASQVEVMSYLEMVKDLVNKASPTGKVGGLTSAGDEAFSGAQIPEEEAKWDAARDRTILTDIESTGSASQGTGQGFTGTWVHEQRPSSPAFVPSWAVSPRVLLVDDDAVSRMLASKFLQGLGCKTNIAVDGLDALKKIDLERYDLVLMDIAMPMLDGISATSIIRKFDRLTPIISMTSSMKVNEIRAYYSSGMNDILPKPFTKEGLLDTLERHLIHLKVMQQIQTQSKQPWMELQAPDNHEFILHEQGLGDNDLMKALAGMSLSPEQLTMMVQSLMNAGGGGREGFEA